MKQLIITLLALAFLYGISMAGGPGPGLWLDIDFGRAPVAPNTSCGTGYEILTGSDGVVIRDSQGGYICLPE